MAQNKILIVDDDTNICELLRLYIEKEGYKTVIVNDGEAAVEAAKKLKILLWDGGYLESMIEETHAGR